MGNRDVDWSMAKYAIHPLAGIFPLVTSLVDEIAADLRKTRQAPVIMLYEGKVLDAATATLLARMPGSSPS
jgi:hypothetical protein